MRRYPRWVFLVMALAGILLYPSIYVVRFYFAAEHLVATAPEIEASLSSAVQRMEGKRLVCLRDVVVEGGVTPHEIQSSNSPIVDARGRFEDGLSDEVYSVLHLNLRIALGIRELVSAKNALMDYLGPRNAYEELCMMARPPVRSVDEEIEASRTPEEIAATEREGEPKLRAHVVRLEELRAMFAQARATHESRKVLFRVIAWATMLLEVVGIGFAFMIMRASLKRS